MASDVASPKQWRFLKTPGSLPPRHWHLFLECSSLPQHLSRRSAFKMKFEHHSLHNFLALFFLSSGFLSTVGAPPLQPPPLDDSGYLCSTANFDFHRARCLSFQGANNRSVRSLVIPLIAAHWRDVFIHMAVLPSQVSVLRAII